jgi:hypothetical protein
MSLSFVFLEFWTRNSKNKNKHLKLSEKETKSMKLKAAVLDEIFIAHEVP